MVRQGPVVIRLAGLLIAGLAVPGASVADPKAEVMDRKPYAIRAHVGFEPGTRIDPSRGAAVLDEWLGLTRRFVGAPWSVQRSEEADTASAIAIEDLTTDSLKGLDRQVDKVWEIRVAARGSGYSLAGRELDVATGWLGEVHRRDVTHPADLPRDLLHLALAMFAPAADVGEPRDGGVSFQVRGGSIPPATPIGEVAPVGSIFRALRIFPKPDGSVGEVREIPYSYFRVVGRDGSVARCEIIRGVGDPLTNRYARKNRLVAIGVKPASSPTRLRFLLKGDRQPAAGYRLIARPIPTGARPSEVGTTDREGRIVLPPGFAGGLVSLRLMAGNEEPMLDVPVMPGETSVERTLIFEPRPATLALEARLEALRDAIVDVVAVRARLELRMKARVDGEDWAGLDEAIREFRKLTPRELFEARLDKIRDEGERQEAELKTLVLTRNARAQIDETRALIDRYLDDDAIRSYEDAASRARAERAAPQPDAASRAVAKTRPAPSTKPAAPPPRPMTKRAPPK